MTVDEVRAHVAELAALDARADALVAELAEVRALQSQRRESLDRAIAECVRANPSTATVIASLLGVSLRTVQYRAHGRKRRRSSAKS